jgi:drug/metabolite transporter (DMT)-like permease
MIPVQRRSGVLMLIGASVSWSTSGLFIRAIHLDTATIILWRGLAGAVGLTLLILWLEGRAGLRGFGRLGRAGWAYALVSGLGMLCFIGALQNTSVAHVAIIYATVPFAAAAGGWFFLREKPSRAAIIASCIALTGAVAMVGLGQDGHITGDILAVVMVFTGAALILIARANPGLPALAAAAVSAVWAPLVCLPFASTAGLNAGNIGLLFAFGLVNTTLAFALFIIGSRRLPAVETALISALEAPMTPLWVWLVFAETPSPATLAGGAVVIGSVFWYISRPTRRDAA